MSRFSAVRDLSERDDDELVEYDQDVSLSPSSPILTRTVSRVNPNGQWGGGMTDSVESSDGHIGDEVPLDRGIMTSPAEGAPFPGPMYRDHEGRIAEVPDGGGEILERALDCIEDEEMMFSQGPPERPCASGMASVSDGSRSSSSSRGDDDMNSPDLVSPNGNNMGGVVAQDDVIYPDDEGGMFIDWTTYHKLVHMSEKQSAASRWADPLLPNNQLITATGKLTEMVKVGVDVSTERGQMQSKGLLETVILPVLHRLMYDEHITLNTDMMKNMMSLIYHCVILFIEKLNREPPGSDIIREYWNLMSIIFDGRCKFYLRVSSIQQHLTSHVCPGDLDNSLFRTVCRPLDVHLWYQSVLVWFAQNRGVETFKRFLAKNVNNETPVREIHQYIDWLLGGFKILNPNFLKILEKDLSFAVHRMLSLSDKQLECEKIKGDVKESAYFRIAVIARAYMAETCSPLDASSVTESIHRLERFKLRLLKNVILVSPFNTRMSALEELYRFLCDYNGDVSNKPSIQQLETWIEDEALVEALYKDNLHHVAYIDRLEKVMGEMLCRGLLNESVLNIIWIAQKGKHDAIQRNVNSLTARLVSHFNRSIVDGFFGRLAASWIADTRKERDVIIDLLKKVGLDFCNRLERCDAHKKHTLQATVNFLWERMCTSDEPASQGQNLKVIDVIFDILEESMACDFGIKELTPSTAAQCLRAVTESARGDANKNVSLAMSDSTVASALRLLKKIINLYDWQSEQPRYASSQPTRCDLIEHLEVHLRNQSQSSNFCQVVVANICQYVQRFKLRMEQQRLLSASSIFTSQSANRVPSEDIIGLRCRLEFLRFYMVQWCVARQKAKGLSPDIFADTTCLESLWDHVVCSEWTEVRDAGFRFYNDIMISESIPVVESIQPFFANRLLILDPATLSMAGFHCFDAFLKRTNCVMGTMFGKEVKMVEEDRDYIVNDVDRIEGAGYLRDLICLGEPLVANRATLLFVQLYSLPGWQHGQAALQSVVKQCKEWLDLEHANRMRTGDSKLLSRVVQTMCDLVDRDGQDHHLCRRLRPSLRKGTLGKGFTLKLFFKDDMHMVYQTAPIPIQSERVFPVHDNMLLGEFVQKICAQINNQGGQLVPYAFILVNKRVGSNHRHGPEDWGHTLSELNIDKDSHLIARMDKMKLGGDPTVDPMFQAATGEKQCELREQLLISVALADCDYLIDSVVRLADEKELGEQSIRLMASLPRNNKLLRNLSIPNADKVVVQDEMSSLLESLRSEVSPARQIYLLMVLNEVLIPSRLALASYQGPFDVQLSFLSCGGVKVCVDLLSNGTFLSDCGFLASHGLSILMKIIPFSLMLVSQLLALEEDSEDTRQLKVIAEKMWTKADCCHKEAVCIISADALDKLPQSQLAQIYMETQLTEENLRDVLQLAMICLEDYSRSAHFSIFDNVTDGEAEVMPELNECEHLVQTSFQTLLLLCSFNRKHAMPLMNSSQWHKYTMMMMSDERTDIAKECTTILSVVICLFDTYDESNRLLHRTIDRLFSELHKANSDIFWGFLSRLIDNLTKRKQLLVGLHERMKGTVEWLEQAQKRSQEQQSHFEDDVVLSGHLNLCTSLVAQLSPEERIHWGASEGGPRLVETLIYYFLLPSSRAFAQQESESLLPSNSLSSTSYGQSSSSVPRSQTAMEMHTASSSSMFDLHASSVIPRSSSAIPLPHRLVAVCGTESSQKDAYQLVVELCVHSEPAMRIVKEQLMEMFYKNRSLGRMTWEYQPDHTLREAGNYVGLRNGGATCYMNSILQQLFMVPDLRNSIMNAEPVISSHHSQADSLQNAESAGIGATVATVSNLSLSDEYSVQILNALQSVFAHLVGYELDTYTPSEFWRTFRMNGATLNLHEQQDALEFYNSVVDLVDEGMKKIGGDKVCEKTFGGLFADEKICKDCPHRYTREEPFTSISIDVRSHNNLLDSLREYVKGDVLENDNAYHCEKCDKKVRAVKRLSIQRLPPTLVVQLKRFEFDWERECPVKYNDYFEFPFDLDMQPYTQESLSRMDDDGDEEIVCGDERVQTDDEDRSASSCGGAPGNDCLYRLKGVVVHSGQATGGHYYSFIRSNDDGRWYKFDDNEVTRYECDPKDVKYKWFGDDGSAVDDYTRKRRQRSWWNAYLVFYEKVAPPSPPSSSSPMLVSTSAAIMTSSSNCTSLPPSVVPVETPLTVDATCSSQSPVLPPIPMTSSRRSSTGSPVSRLHKHFSTMSLSSRMRQMPLRLEEMVRRQNTRIMHERNQYNNSFFEFIMMLSRKTILSKPKDVRLYQHATEILSNFLIYTCFHASSELRTSCRFQIRFDNSWVEVHNQLMTISSCRHWFIANMMFNVEICRIFLLEAKEADVRMMYAKMLHRVLALSFDEGDTVDQLKQYMTPHLRSILNSSPTLRSSSCTTHSATDLILETLYVLLTKEWDKRHWEVLIILTPFAEVTEPRRPQLLTMLIRRRFLFLFLSLCDYSFSQICRGSHQGFQTVMVAFIQMVMHSLDCTSYQINMLREIGIDSVDMSCLRNPHLDENTISIGELDVADANYIMDCFAFKRRPYFIRGLLDLMVNQWISLLVAVRPHVLYLRWLNDEATKRVYTVVISNLLDERIAEEPRVTSTLRVLSDLLHQRDYFHLQGYYVQFLLWEVELMYLDQRGNVRQIPDNGLTALLSLNRPSKEENLLRAIVVVLEADPTNALAALQDPRSINFIESVYSTFLARRMDIPTPTPSSSHPDIPTSDDVFIRFDEFVQRMKGNTSEELETAGSCSSEGEPLDLSMSTRGSSATPQSGEKRPFPEDDSDSPLGDRRDSKKFNDGSEVPRVGSMLEDQDLLMSTSRSANDVIAESAGNAPPPAYDGPPPPSYQ